MTKKNFFHFIIIFSLVFPNPEIFGQVYSLSGSVRDRLNNSPLPYVNILVINDLSGTTTNEKGEFILKTDHAELTLRFSSLGYTSREMTISFTDNKLIVDIHLLPQALLLEEIAVYSRPNNDFESSLGSMENSGLRNSSSMIPDVFRSLQTLPSVTTNNEFDSRFNIRGGSYDENLTLVNSTTIYDPFHIKSVPNASVGIFNVNMIKSVHLIPGGFSARYGDKMNSVLKIDYREGNKTKFKGGGSASLSNIDAYFEGPAGENLTFIVGGRRSYLGYILSMLDLENSLRPIFYDVHGVFNYIFAPGHKLSAKFTHSGDKFYYEPDKKNSGPRYREQIINGNVNPYYLSSNSEEVNDGNYHNNLMSLQSLNFISRNMMLKSELVYYEQNDDERRNTTYESIMDFEDINLPNEVFRSQREMRNDLNIKTIEGKIESDFQINSTYQLNLGINYQNLHYDYELSDNLYIRSFTGDSLVHERTETGIDFENESNTTNSYKLSSFAENVIQLNKNLVMSLGGRLDHFEFNRETSLSPRIAMVYHNKSGTIIRGSWGYYYQSPGYRQLKYSYSTDSNTKSQLAIHYNLGYEQNLFTDNNDYSALRFKIEAYYKNYKNLIPAERATFDRIIYSKNNDAEGWVAGVELYLFFERGNFLSSVSYGFLDSFEDILSDNSPGYPRSMGQKHSISFNNEYLPGLNWRMGLRFIYGSGYPYTARQKYYSAEEKNWTWIKSGKNSSYLPPYKRVDFRIGKMWDLNFGALEFYFEVSNILNFKNIQGYEYEISSDGQPVLTEKELWPILPNLGLRLDF